MLERYVGKKRMIPRRIRPVLSFLLVLWVMFFLQTWLPLVLPVHGIRPLDWPQGAWGILWAPLLHSDLSHLVSNTIGLAVFGTWVSLQGKRLFLSLCVWTGLLGGSAVWLLGGRGTEHIGASGLVFGLFGFLLTQGLFSRRVLPLLSSMAVAALYGGTIVGILPGEVRVSWQSHLFGFISGMTYAYLHYPSSKTE